MERSGSVKLTRQIVIAISQLFRVQKGIRLRGRSLLTMTCGRPFLPSEKPKTLSPDRATKASDSTASVIHQNRSKPNYPKPTSHNRLPITRSHCRRRDGFGVASSSTGTPLRPRRSSSQTPKLPITRGSKPEGIVKSQLRKQL